MLTSCRGPNEREDCFRVSVQRRLFRLNDQDNNYFQTRMIQSRLYKIRARNSTEKEKNEARHISIIVHPALQPVWAQCVIKSMSALWDIALNGLLLFMITHIFLDYKGQIHFPLSLPFYFNQNILRQSHKARLDYIKIERLNPITTFKTFYLAFSQGFTIAHWPAVLEQSNDFIR